MAVAATASGNGCFIGAPAAEGVVVEEQASQSRNVVSVIELYPAVEIHR